MPNRQPEFVRVTADASPEGDKIGIRFHCEDGSSFTVNLGADLARSLMAEVSFALTSASLPGLANPTPA